MSSIEQGIGLKPLEGISRRPLSIIETVVLEDGSRGLVRTEKLLEFNGNEVRLINVEPMGEMQGK
jgi:hypothetical protein